MRPDNPKGWSLEQRKLDCRAMQGDWCHRPPPNLSWKGFDKDFLKILSLFICWSALGSLVAARGIQLPDQ